jgi:ferredoxin-type protein NapH
MVAMAKADRGSLGVRLAPWRVWVQTAFLAVWLDPLMLRMHNACAPVFHCYSCPLATFACPIGVLANFSALHLMPFIAVGTLVFFGGIFGTFVCGWACPFGFLQDMIGKAPLPKLRVPAWLGYGRYIVPYVAKQAAAGQPVIWPSAVKLTILVLILVAAFVKWRPWCSLFCPLGAIFGLFNRASLLVLRFHADRCDGCGGCSRACRYDVLPDKNVNNSRCVRCLECTRCSSITVGSVLGGSEGTAAGPRR